MGIRLSISKVGTTVLVEKNDGVGQTPCPARNAADLPRLVAVLTHEGDQIDLFYSFIPFAISHSYE